MTCLKPLVHPSNAFSGLIQKLRHSRGRAQCASWAIKHVCGKRRTCRVRLQTIGSASL